VSAAPVRLLPSRSGLGFRVLLLVGVGVLLPSFLVAGIAWARLRELDERLIRSREEAAVAAAGQLDEALTGDLEALQRIASSLSLDPEARHMDRERELLRRAYLGFRFVGGVFLLDGQGTLLLEEPQHARPVAPPPDLPELREVLRSGRPRVSGLVRDGDAFRIYAMVPVSSWRGSVAGIVGGLVDPNMPRQSGALRRLAPEGQGWADLVGPEGTVLASTDRTRVHRPGTCGPTATRHIREHRPFAGRCGDCHQPGDEPSVLAFAPLSAAPWGVALVQPESVVLATSGALPRSLPLVALGVLLLAGGFAWGATRSITRPVGVLTAEAEKIASGRLDEPIPDLGRDEVGRLGRSLDRMRASLADAMGLVARANSELEGRVEERTRELHQAYQKLRDRDEQRARLLRTVITAQEDERKRIARELHDETTQSLAVLVMGLESAVAALRSGEREPRLDEVKALAVHILDEIHRLILDLRPSVLDDLGLYSAVRWYAERHLGERGISLRCELGPAPRTRLAPEVEIAVFRICQEAINNVLRHARADSVLIQLEAARGELRIEIEDDGQGFDPEGPGPPDRPHYGLLGIQERAELLGGSATIESAEGQGTRVVVRVPLPQGAETPVEAAAPGSPAAAGDSPAPASDNPPKGGAA
jgi:signal transduction histidine kinase